MTGGSLIDMTLRDKYAERTVVVDESVEDEGIVSPLGLPQVGGYGEGQRKPQPRGGQSTFKSPSHVLALPRSLVVANYGGGVRVFRGLRQGWKDWHPSLGCCAGQQLVASQLGLVLICDEIFQPQPEGRSITFTVGKIGFKDEKLIESFVDPIITIYVVCRDALQKRLCCPHVRCFSALGLHGKCIAAT